MSLKIVVVDDEAPITQWLQYCIGRAFPQHSVLVASTGEEAFALICEHKPDIVFTDIRMPGITGLELMRRVLDILPFTAFAILTNHAEFGYAKQAISLGAKEYFLKSEMRTSDIEGFIAGVMERGRKITSAKTEDVMPSGTIDLFAMYKNADSPAHLRSFWEKQGLAEGTPYLVLCVHNTNQPAHWRLLSTLAAQAGAEGGARTVAAGEKEYQYAVLQAPTAAQAAALARPLAAKMLQGIGGVGVSAPAAGYGDFVTAARQAACALNSQFFAAPGVTWLEDIITRPRLDRDALRGQKRAAIALLAQRRYDQAANALKDFFACFNRVAAADVDWAVDYCRRMVLSVEERYYQLADAAAQQLAIPETMEKCRAWCLQLCEKLRAMYTGRCSPCIETALEYIHEHYRESISMAEVARQVYRSPEYFSRQFKDEVGENFSVYLTLYRLDRAQELLQHTGLRVAQVAETVGYTTPGYFSRLYKKYKGISPEQERGSNP